MVVSDGGRVVSEIENHAVDDGLGVFTRPSMGGAIARPRFADHDCGTPSDYLERSN